MLKGLGLGTSKIQALALRVEASTTSQEHGVENVAGLLLWCADRVDNSTDVVNCCTLAP